MAFSPNETSDQWQGSTNPTPVGTSGFGYASFLLGAVDSFTIAPAADMRLGNHAIGLYAQDSWKVTRKLTLDYGLRYDYQTYLKEQYGRMQDADFTQINPVVNRPGTVIYEGNGPGQCHCQFSHKLSVCFRAAAGSRLPDQSQDRISEAGAGLHYGTASNDAELLLSIEDFYPHLQRLNGTYGVPAIAHLSPQGNPVCGWQPFWQSHSGTLAQLRPQQISDPHCLSWEQLTLTCYTPQNRPLYQHADPSSRPPRIFTWSVGLQRELNRNLVVEASYVGNRGAWFTAPGLDIVNYNALNITDLPGLGLNINNAADRSLLTSTLSSTTAIQRGYGTPAYVGFPVNQTVAQSLRPRPQWTDVPPFLGPPLGDTWYDSLQVKMTKRFSHGFAGQGILYLQQGTQPRRELPIRLISPRSATVVNDVYNPAIATSSSLALQPRPRTES